MLLVLVLILVLVLELVLIRLGGEVGVEKEGWGWGCWRKITGRGGRSSGQGFDGKVNDMILLDEEAAGKETTDIILDSRYEI